MERGTYVDDCGAAFPSVTPVCAATIATGAAPDRAPHPVDELVLPRRGALRRVRLELQRRAARSASTRSLTDTVYNMNLEHLSRATSDGVRVARRRRRAHGRHDVPDVPRPPPPRADRRDARSTRLAGGNAVPPRRLGPARALLRRPLRQRARPAAGRSSGMPGMRDQHAGCVGAYLVEHDLFDFLLLSLPDNDTHSHKHGPARAGRPRSPRPTASSSASCTPAGGPEAFLDEHAVIVVADHSHAQVEAQHRPRSTRSTDLARAASPTRRARRTPRSRLPGPALGDGLRARPRAARRAVAARARRGRSAIEGVDLVMWRDGDGEAIVRAARGELRFAPGGDVADAARPRAGRRGRARRRSEARVESGVLVCDALPRRAGARVGGADVPDVRRRAALGGARLRVPRLGRRRPRRRRQPRLAAPRRLARRAAVVRQRARRPGRRGAVVDRATWRRWCSTSSVSSATRRMPRRGRSPTLADRATRPPASTSACTFGVRHGLRRPHNWLQLVRFALVGASGYVVNLAVFTLLRPRRSRSTTGSPRSFAFLVAVTNNFVWNRHWTFDARDGHAGRQAARFLAVSVAAFGFNLPCWSARRGARAARGAGPGDRDRRATPLNFIGNKLWSFAR